MRTALRTHVVRELQRTRWRRALVDRGIVGAFLAIPGAPVPPRLRNQVIRGSLVLVSVNMTNFTPVINTMTTSGTQTIPSGASVCFVEGFGESGGGGTGAGTGCTRAGGGGGGTGAYGAINFNVAGQSGHTWTVTIGTGASSTQHDDRRRHDHGLDLDRLPLRRIRRRGPLPGRARAPRVLRVRRALAARPIRRATRAPPERSSQVARAPRVSSA